LNGRTRGHCAKRELRRCLNADGIKSTRDGGYKLGQKNTALWSASSVKRILQNEIYTGVRVWNKTSRIGEKLPVTGKKSQRQNDEKDWVRVEGYAPVIIAQQLWDRVQMRLRQDAEAYAAKHTAKTNRQYLLSGLLRCASCGASYTIGLHIKKVPHYRCGLRGSRGRVCCLNTVLVPQPDLERKVKQVVDSVVKNPSRLEALVAEHNKRISTTNQAQLGVIHSLKARQTALVEERQRLVDAIAQGTGGAVPGTGPGSSSAKHTQVGGKANDQGTLASPGRVSGRLDDEPPAEKTVGVSNGNRSVMNISELPEIARLRIQMRLVA
jgi:site-specific DNA recombinase